MAATRTQVYLTREQREKLDRLREDSGASLAELIRAALDEYLGRERPDVDGALDGSFGAIPDLEVPAREEWAARAAPPSGG